MKNSLVLPILFLLFLCSFNIQAQKLSASEQKRVNDVFKKGKVAYFKFQVTSMQEVAPLAKIISIDKNQGRVIYAHANKDQFSKFIVKGYPYTIIKYTNPVAKPKTKKAVSK